MGKHRTSIERTGLDPKTKEGELGLLFVRVYRSLHALMGGDQALMRHWIEQPTPFRYPPLISGSRFGRTHQRHLFYGARALETALTERSFHALRMLEDSPLPRGCRVRRLQTAFTVEITAERGLSLQKHLTAEALATITDPSSYEASQRCGDAIRERGVQAFEVPSARSPQTPPAVGVLTPYAFSSTPFDFQDWSLEISAEGVTAVSFAGGLQGTYTRDQFLVDGIWPVP